MADIRKEEQMEKERQEEEVAFVEIEEEDANPEWSERLKELNKASTKKKKRRRRKKKKKKKKKKRKRSEL